MPGTGADMREAESFQDLADRALMIVDAEAFADDALEVDTSPTYDAMHQPIRTGFDELGKFGLLIRREPRPRALRPVVQKPIGAALVETMDPITQGLTVHATNPRRV